MNPIVCIWNVPLSDWWIRWLIADLNPFLTTSAYKKRNCKTYRNTTSGFHFLSSKRNSSGLSSPFFNKMRQMYNFETHYNLLSCSVTGKTVSWGHVTASEEQKTRTEQTENLLGACGVGVCASVVTNPWRSRVKRSVLETANILRRGWKLSVQLHGCVHTKPEANCFCRPAEGRRWRHYLLTLASSTQLQSGASYPDDLCWYLYTSIIYHQYSDSTAVLVFMFSIYPYC